MSIAANIFIVLGCLIILLASINFSKTKDLFSSVHFILINNIYGVTFLFIGLLLLNFSLFSAIKIIILILLNILITIIICHCITRRAIINKINPIGEIEKLNYLTEETDE
jgi:multisubunit Na+/H+ antiporter MnhG subunit